MTSCPNCSSKNQEYTMRSTFDDVNDLIMLKKADIQRLEHMRYVLENGKFPLSDRDQKYLIMLVEKRLMQIE